MVGNKFLIKINEMPISKYLTTNDSIKNNASFPTNFFWNLKYKNPAQLNANKLII